MKDVCMYWFYSLINLLSSISLTIYHLPINRLGKIAEKVYARYGLEYFDHFKIALPIDNV